MSKKQEYNIKFYIYSGMYGNNNPVFDTSSAKPPYHFLYFIKSLSEYEVVCLLEDIDKILEGKPYDPDFLTSSEIFDIYNVEFKNPHFFVDGYEVITIQDLKPLLEEWLDFLKFHFKQPKVKWYNRLLNLFRLSNLKSKL